MVPAGLWVGSNPSPEGNHVLGDPGPVSSTGFAFVGKDTCASLFQAFIRAAVSLASRTEVSG